MFAEKQAITMVAPEPNWHNTLACWTLCIQLHPFSSDNDYIPLKHKSLWIICEFKLLICMHIWQYPIEHNPKNPSENSQPGKMESRAYSLELIGNLILLPEGIQCKLLALIYYWCIDHNLLPSKFCILLGLIMCYHKKYRINPSKIQNFEGNRLWSMHQ